MISTDEKKNELRIKQNDTTQLMRERFNEFLNESRYSQIQGSKSRSSNILSSLKSQSYTIYDQDQLCDVFNSLLAKTCNNRYYGKTNWGETETNYLITIVILYCESTGKEAASLNEKDWEHLEQVFPTKQAYHIRKRWNSLLKVELLQSPWTPEEDDLLQKLVSQYGSERQWKKIAEKINSTFKNGAFRHSRQCRERWINYVDPAIKRGKWTYEEDLELMKSFIKLGKKWSAIAKVLGDRTENAVKNRWKSLIRKETHHSDQLNDNLTQVDESNEIRIAQGFIEKAMRDTLEQKKRMHKQEHNFAMSEMIAQDSSNTSENQSSSYSQKYFNDEGPKQIFNNVDALNYGYQQGAVPMSMNQPVYYNQTQFGYPDYNQGMPFYRNYQDNIYNQWAAPNQAPVYNYGPANEQMRNFTFGSHLGQEGAQMTNPIFSQSFKLNNNIMASQEFKREAKKPESQVFFAIVDVNGGVIQVLDKVSETNWPGYVENQCNEQGFY